MIENLVQGIHDEVARSRNLAQASVRPSGTTARQLASMERDVLRKLQIEPASEVLEIGCGIGLFSLPLARAAARYVGIDFAPEAARRADGRLRAAGLGERAEVVCRDILAPADDRPIGCFDRVLMYAVLHYARSEEEAVGFLRATVDSLAVGGVALIGNVPLGDLEVDWPSTAGGWMRRAFGAARWLAKEGVGSVPLTRRWKAQWMAESTLRRIAPGDDFPDARLPQGYTLSLTTLSVERWLETIDARLAYGWKLPAPGVPLAAGRADLIVRKW